MRLIDADKMRENLAWCKEQSGDSDSFWDDVIERLDVQPTVDAAPVIHARWIESDFVYTDTYYECSNCGEAWVLNDGTPVENNMNYCPRCGARMDGEEDG